MRFQIAQSYWLNRNLKFHSLFAVLRHSSSRQNHNGQRETNLAMDHDVVYPMSKELKCMPRLDAIRVVRQSDGSLGR